MAYPTVALSELLTRLQDSVGETETIISSLTATGGSTTTIVGPARSEPDDRFVEWFAYIDTDAGGAGAAPQGEERRVTDFVTSTDTWTVEYAFTAAVAVDDVWSIRKIHPRSRYVRALNNSLEQAVGIYDDFQFSEARCGRSNRLEETINNLTAATCKKIYKIWISTYDTLTDSTATSGASTTLTDTAQSWATSGANSPGAQSMYVTIYDATGAGQVRTVTSNTATVLTVGTAWGTNPDSTSLYKVLRAEREATPIRVLNAYVDWGNREVLFGSQPEEGQIIRVEWARDPVALSAAADTTSVPPGYIMLMAQAFLWERLIGKDGYMEAGRTAQYFRQMADNFIARNPQVKPNDTIWEYAPGKQTLRADYPFERG